MIKKEGRIKLIPNVFQALFFQNYTKQQAQRMFEAKQTFFKQKAKEYFREYKNLERQNIRNYTEYSNTLFNTKSSPFVLVEETGALIKIYPINTIGRLHTAMIDRKLKNISGSAITLPYFYNNGNVATLKGKYAYKTKGGKEIIKTYEQLITNKTIDQKYLFDPNTRKFIGRLEEIKINEPNEEKYFKPPVNTTLLNFIHAGKIPKNLPENIENELTEIYKNLPENTYTLPDGSNLYGFAWALLINEIKYTFYFRKAYKEEGTLKSLDFPKDIGFQPVELEPFSEKSFFRSIENRITNFEFPQIEAVDPKKRFGQKVQQKINTLQRKANIAQVSREKQAILNLQKQMREIKSQLNDINLDQNQRIKAQQENINAIEKYKIKTNEIISSDLKVLKKISKEMEDSENSLFGPVESRLEEQINRTRDEETKTALKAVLKTRRTMKQINDIHLRARLSNINKNTNSKEIFRMAVDVFEQLTALQQSLLQTGELESLVERTLKRDIIENKIAHWLRLSKKIQDDIILLGLETGFGKFDFLN
jgi:hypothetical protein